MARLLWSKGWRGWLARKLYRLFWRRIRYIPRDEKLWRAVYKKDQVYEDGQLKPAFFRDRSGLSCDLARFSTVERSRRGYSLQWPEEAGLVEFSVGLVRDNGSDVEHAPVRQPHQNYAHCLFTELLHHPDTDNLAEAASWVVKQRVRPPKD